MWCLALNVRSDNFLSNRPEEFKIPLAAIITIVCLLLKENQKKVVGFKLDIFKYENFREYNKLWHKMLIYSWKLIKTGLVEAISKLLLIFNSDLRAFTVNFEIKHEFYMNL